MGQAGHRHETQSCSTAGQATTAHANRWPHAQTTDGSDFDDEYHEGNMQDLRRPCSPQTTTECLSSSPPGLAPPQLRLQNNQATHGRAPRTRREDPTTKARAATKAPLEAIIVAKQKSTPPKWPPQQTTRRRCRKPRGEDAATPAAKMPPSTGLPVVACSETMPPRRRKTRRRLHRPIQRIWDFPPEPKPWGEAGAPPR